jgi:hypothetical protein
MEIRRINTISLNFVIRMWMDSLLLFVVESAHHFGKRKTGAEPRGFWRSGGKGRQALTGEVVRRPSTRGVANLL